MNKTAGDRLTDLEALTQWRRLKFLLGVARIMRDHKVFIESTSETMLKPGLRRSELLKEIKDLRWLTRQPRRNFRQRWVQTTINAITGVSKLEPKFINIEVGKKPLGVRGKQYGRVVHMVHVGWMWRSHVYQRFYTSEHDFGVVLILSATPIRSTAKNVEMYEAVAYHPQTGDNIKGYIARSSHTEQPFSAFAKTASLAVRRQEELVSAAMDAMFTKEKTND